MTATWEELRRRWEEAPDGARFTDTLRVKASQVPQVVASLSPLIERIIDSLPDFYVGQIRPAMPYLLREWMPIGYSCMLAIDDTEALRAATGAVLGYGAAVTVLDDVADTDVFDQILGEGSSDAIALAAQAYARSGYTKIPDDLPEPLRPIVELVREYTDRFVAYLLSTESLRKFEPQFRLLLDAMFDGVVLCRTVRRSMQAKGASHSDLTELRAATPHGMTVAIIGLIGFAHHDVEIDGGYEAFLRDALLAQVACHYQNGIATLERELLHHDPSNPIVLNAIEEGQLDAGRYVRGAMDAAELPAKLAGSRAHIESQLKVIMAELESRKGAYRDGGADQFFELSIFGVRNLSVLYELALGRV